MLCLSSGTKEIFDCKTRYNSLLLILQRVYLLKNCKKYIRKTKVYLKVNVFLFLLIKLKLYQPLLKRLNKSKCRGPLSSRCKFVHRQRCHNFYVKKLKMLITLSVKNYIQLSMQQRRTNMSGILQYLHNGRTNVESESEV